MLRGKKPERRRSTKLGSAHFFPVRLDEFVERKGGKRPRDLSWCRRKKKSERASAFSPGGGKKKKKSKGRVLYRRHELERGAKREASTNLSLY